MAQIVRVLLWVAATYGAAGALFALAFQWRGLATTDAGSRGVGIGFRLLIMPGVIALWPLIALRWRAVIHGGSFLDAQDSPVPQRRLRAAHALAWKALAVLVPILVAAALWWRPKQPSTAMLNTLAGLKAAANPPPHR
jgi:hypothetical protein